MANSARLTDEVSKHISLMETISQGYILVTWPDILEYVELDWFTEEAFLEAEGRFGGSAYFIPINRILDIKNYE